MNSGSNIPLIIPAITAGIFYWSNPPIGAHGCLINNPGRSNQHSGSQCLMDNRKEPFDN